MNFNVHSGLEGQHAFLSGSKYHWINYSEEKLVNTYTRFLAVRKGTQLHEFARQCIELGIKLPRTKHSLNHYVNDAIGFRMTPEVTLFYSYNAFGTADAISYRSGVLRIHDLKTGLTPASTKQVDIYAALFCLEYDVNPEDIEMKLRIYQVDELQMHEPKAAHIRAIMEKIILFDKRIDQITEEESSWLK